MTILERIAYTIGEKLNIRRLTRWACHRCWNRESLRKIKEAQNAYLNAK